MSTSGISTTSSAPSSRLDAVVAHVVASAAATSTADLDFSGIGDPAKISAAHPAQLHNFVNGEWTAGTAKTMELPDPMNGETFMKMPLTETDAELQPFLQVVVLTGHGSFDTALESGRSQAFRYLHKPFDFSGLLEILHEAYDVKRKAQREQFQKELKESVGDGASSSAILSTIDELRKKYELE